MPTHFLTPELRLEEAERLIAQLREILGRPEEEIVMNYLDHAMQALRIVSTQRGHQRLSISETTVQAKDRG